MYTPKSPNTCGVLSVTICSFLRTRKRRRMRKIAAGTGGVFQGLDGAEKGAEDDVVALDIRVGRPFVARHAVGLFFWQAGLGEGQFCADGDFEFVQEGVIAGRGAHLAFLPNAWRGGIGHPCSVPPAERRSHPSKSPARIPGRTSPSPAMPSGGVRRSS